MEDYKNHRLEVVACRLQFKTAYCTLLPAGSRMMISCAYGNPLPPSPVSRTHVRSVRTPARCGGRLCLTRLSLVPASYQRRERAVPHYRQARHRHSVVLGRLYRTPRARARDRVLHTSCRNARVPCRPQSVGLDQALSHNLSRGSHCLLPPRPHLSRPHRDRRRRVCI